MNHDHLIVALTGGKTEAIAAVDAAIAALPRQGQAQEQADTEQVRLEALRARLVALP